jgi:hypothetical protein
LGRGLRAEFPNPERVGCPGREIVAAIAAHRMPLSQAESYLDHLTSCSPCYRDFLQLQTEYRKRRTRMIFAVAASVLIVAGLAWLLGAGSLYPAYVRGLAYLAARRGREAAGEFQKVLDRRGSVISDPVGAPAKMHLVVPTHSQETRKRPVLPTKTFSRFGRTQILTSRSRN